MSHQFVLGLYIYIDDTPYDIRKTWNTWKTIRKTRNTQKTWKTLKILNIPGFPGIVDFPGFQDSFPGFPESWVCHALHSPNGSTIQLGIPI